MIRIDSRDLSGLVDRLEDVSRNFPRDIARVLVDSKRRVKADATRAAIAVYNIGRNSIAGGWNVFDLGQFAFALVGSRKPISALSYRARNTRSGVSFHALVETSAKVIKSSFFAPNPSKPGSNLPWVRYGAPRTMTKGRYKGKVRQPIHPLFGPSLADMLNNPKVFEPLRTSALLRMTEQLSKRIDRIVARG